VAVTRPTEEKLMAFADGQLPVDEMREIEAVVATDPELRATVESFRKSAGLVKAAFDDVLRESPPQTLIDAIERGSRRADRQVVDQASASRQRDDRTSSASARSTEHRTLNADRWRLPLAASIALLLGVGIGSLFGTTNRNVTEQAGIALGAVSPAATLGRLLEKSASGLPFDMPHSDNKLMAVATFRDRLGRVCREVELVSAGATSVPVAAAVACRNASGTWNVEGAFNLGARSEVPGQYVPSGASEQDALEVLLKVLGAGEVLSAQDEARLIGKNWRE